MKIETKFDIGQKVWRIRSWHETRFHVHRNKWVVLDHEPIFDGDIRLSTAKGCYWPKGKPGVDEDNIFLTRKIAQAECNKRNREKL